MPAVGASRALANVLECGSRSCRFCMFERCQWHTKAVAAATALQTYAATRFTGSRNTMLVPTPSIDATLTSPPCASITCFTM